MWEISARSEEAPPGTTHAQYELNPPQASCARAHTPINQSEAGTGSRDGFGAIANHGDDVGGQIFAFKLFINMGICAPNTNRFRWQLAEL